MGCEDCARTLAGNAAAQKATSVTAMTFCMWTVFICCLEVRQFEESWAETSRLASGSEARFRNDGQAPSPCHLFRVLQIELAS